MTALTDSRRQAIATVWFGLAAALVVATNPVLDRTVMTATAPGFLVLCVLPCVLGAAAGYLVGAAILDPPDACGARWAAGRGIGVALLGYVAYVPLVSLWLFVTLSYGRLPALGEAIAALVGILVYVIATSIVWLAWLIISVGAAAGVSLFLLRRRLGAPPT